MKRLVLISALMMITSLHCAAGTRSVSQITENFHVKYGIEWGYLATFMNSYHTVYFDPDAGYRIDREGTDMFLYSNGYASARLGVEMFGHYSATVLAGYCGIRQDRRILPLTLRAAYHLNSYDETGSMVFLEGGAGIQFSEESAALLLKAGYGYRLKMSRKSSLDFMASLQMSGDHPGIYNPDIPGYVPDIQVRRSDSLCGAICFSIAINF